MFKFLSRLFGGVSPAPLQRPQEPPPGIGWRAAPGPSTLAPWDVWNGPRRVASFPTREEAEAWARKQNLDRDHPAVAFRDDGKYCVNCRSRETDDSLRARGFLNCCPERYVIPELWHVSADALADGYWRLWRPVHGLDTISAARFDTQEEAQQIADRLNADVHRFGDLSSFSEAGLRRATPPRDESGASAGFEILEVIPGAVSDAELREITNPRIVIEPKAPKHRQWTRSDFLNVTIPPGVKAVVGPLTHPDTGKWHLFDAAGPREPGYTAKTNAQRAARRINGAA